MIFDFWYGEEFLIEQEQISCYGYERLRHVTGHFDPEIVFLITSYLEHDKK